MLAEKSEEKARPVLVGNEHRGGTETTAARTLKQKGAHAELNRLANYYNRDADLLIRFHLMVSRVPNPLKGFFQNPLTVLEDVWRKPKKLLRWAIVRPLRVMRVEWQTGRLRNADIMSLSPEHLVILIHWYVDTKFVPGSFYDIRSWLSFLRGRDKLWHAHECAEYLVVYHCNRYSTTPKWEQAYYRYLNALVGAKRGYAAPLVNQMLREALKAADAWSTLPPGERLIGARHAVARRAAIADLYFSLTERDWTGTGAKELRILANSILQEALLLARGFAAMPDDAVRIERMLAHYETKLG